MLAFAAGVPAAAQKYVTNVDLLRGEKWWGLFLSDSPSQPFVEPFAVNTSDVRSCGGYIPMMLSSEGRYIWSDAPIAVEFDGERIKIGCDEQQVKVKKSGKSLREAYIVCCHTNFKPSGKTPAPALFTAPVYDTDFIPGAAQGEEEVVAYARRLLDEGFPVGTIVVPDGWRSFNSGNGFDRELYPNPRGMVERLHALGFKVMLTVTPCVPTVGRNYLSALRGQRLLMSPDNYPLTADCGLGSRVAFYDLADDARFESFARDFEALRRDIPFDGYRFDCGALPASFTGDKRARFIENWMKLGKGIDFCQYYGGCAAQFAPYVTGVKLGVGASDDLADMVEDMVAAGLMGLPYAAPVFADVNSSQMPMPSAEKYMGAVMQTGAMMPVAVVSAAPWRLTDGKQYAALKQTLNFRASLAKYLEDMAKESARTGEPFVRHMEYQFPRNGFADCNDQFMLGAKYLIAPNVKGEDSRMVRLPKGTWVDRNKKRFKGPLVMEADCADGRLIYFELLSK